MKDWFSNADLVGLPGMPTTVQGVIYAANKGAWLSRPRQGRGGGKEYHVSCLPTETREALALRHVQSLDSESAEAGRSMAAMATLAERVEDQAQLSAAQTALTKARRGSVSAQQRLDAKLCLIAAFRAFSAQARLGDFNDKLAFVMRYNAGEIAVEPWVRECVSELHVTTLYRWMKQAQAEVESLAGRWKGKQSLIDSQPELREYLLGYLVEHPHAKIAMMWRITAKHFEGREIQMPSERALLNWIARWKTENAGLLMAATNPDAWKNRRMAAFGDHAASYLNEEWQFDGSPADLMLAEGRYNLIAVVDVWSRRAKLLVVKSARATAVATLVRHALLDWGVPTYVKTDNGAEYTGMHITRVLAALGITQKVCAPFSGWQKPHVERFFRSFAHDLVELLPGFVGHNVTERKAIEARKSFAERLFKKGETVEVKLTAAQFQELCDTWVESIYSRRSHSGLDGQTPQERYTSYTGGIRRIDNVRALDILLAEAPRRNGRPPVVGKKGIQLDGCVYIAPELGEFVGEPVEVRYDPTDVGRIYVFTTLGEFLCIAEDPDITGISRDAVAGHAKQKQAEAVRAARKQLKELAKKHKTKDAALDYLNTLAQEALADKVALFPKPTQNHETPALAAAAEAAEAQAGLEQAKDSGTLLSPAARARQRTAFETDQVEREHQARQSTVISSERFAQLRAELEREEAEAAARAMAPPVFNTPYDRAFWLHKMNRLEGRVLSGEEEDFLARFRRESRSGWADIESLVGDLTIAHRHDKQ